MNRPEASRRAADGYNHAHGLPRGVPASPRRDLDAALFDLVRERTHPIDLEAAGAMSIPRGLAKGVRLRDLACQDNAADWARWALTKDDGYWPVTFRASLRVVARELLGLDDDQGQWAA